jgi:hypothetical protein
LTRTPMNAFEKKQDSYELEKIVAKRTSAGVLEYQVKWKDYPTAQNTWEPVVNLVTCEPSLEEWRRRRGGEEWWRHWRGRGGEEWRRRRGREEWRRRRGGEERRGRSGGGRIQVFVELQVMFE